MGRTAEKLEIDSIEDMEEQLHGHLYVTEMQREALTMLMESIADNSKGKGVASAPE